MTSSNQRKGTGWIKDIPHKNDHRFSAPKLRPGLTIPKEAVLYTPPVIDQGFTNSCTGFASASLYRYMLKYLGRPEFQPSPLFNYWFGRHVPRLGWETEDEGAMPRDVMQSMISNGVVAEQDWPFDVERINERPPQTVLAKAKQNRVIEGKYVRMLANDNLYHLKYSLAQGLPFLAGLMLFTSFFDTGTDGMVPMPNTNEIFEGGHLLYCNGYSDDLQRFRCPNSWGEGMGAKGVYWIPYSYIANGGLAGDFWRIEAIT